MAKEKELQLPPAPKFEKLEKVTQQLIAATQRGMDAARKLTNHKVLKSTALRRI